MKKVLTIAFLSALFISFSYQQPAFAQSWTPGGEITHSCAFITGNPVGCIVGCSYLGNASISVSTSHGYSCNTTSTNFPASPNWECTNYSIPTSPSVVNVTLSASRTGDDANGLSVLDVLLIQRHILGLQPIVESFDLVAADVTGDAIVNVSDVIAIQNLFVNSTPLPDGSWRMIPRFYFFNRPNFCDEFFADPLRTVDGVPYSTFTSGSVTFGLGPNLAPSGGWTSFYSVKIGDVNGTASGALRAEEELDTRSLISLNKELPVDKVPTDEAWVSVSLENLTEIAAFQMGITLPIELDISEVQSQLSFFNKDAYHIAKNPESGKTEFKVFWFDHEKTTQIDEEKTVLRFKIRGEQDFSLDAVLSEIELSDEILGTDFYTIDGPVTPTVTIKLESPKLVDAAAVKVQPNPFTTDTEITFFATNLGKGHLKIFNGFGQLVDNLVLEVNNGWNRVKINIPDLPIGILYYTLSSPGLEYRGKLLKTK